MLVLALDTTSRPGSLALARDGVILESRVGPADRTHAERLPKDLTDLLADHRLRLADVDVFAVAAGPGSFTGLRIGIATIQGLAFAFGRRVVAVSALDALVEIAVRPGKRTFVGAWIDARRHEVFSALYACESTGPGMAGSFDVLDGPTVGPPAVTLTRWLSLGTPGPVVFIGDGTVTFRELLASAGSERLEIIEPTPALAPAVARIATTAADRGLAVLPHAVQPLYVRRPDAELARDRRRFEP
jgi:tRNA threonylcarbamoyladenosine biosynthesis protein TsaB